MDVFVEYAPLVLSGLGVTVSLALVSLALAIGLGLRLGATVAAVINAVKNCSRLHVIFISSSFCKSVRDIFVVPSLFVFH